MSETEDQLLSMIVQESAPGLRRGLAAAHHVFADGALCNVDAQLEQFTMDAGRTPNGVFAAHSADQITDVARKRGSPRVAPPNRCLPGIAVASVCFGRGRESHAQSRRSSRINLGRFGAQR